jgi:hypothetical protein
MILFIAARVTIGITSKKTLQMIRISSKKAQPSMMVPSMMVPSMMVPSMMVPSLMVERLFPYAIQLLKIV